jgi:hypothetical protein
MAYSPDVYTLGIIDLVIGSKGRSSLTKNEPRRRSGHYLGLGVDLLEENDFPVLPGNVRTVEGTDAAFTLD